MRGTPAGAVSVQRCGDAGGNVTQVEWSIVICTRHRPDALDTCLEAVARLETHVRYEVIVVDNSSGDDRTRAVAERHGARYVLEPCVGLSIARNTGAVASRGEFVAFTDDDAIPDPAWLSNHDRVLQDRSLSATTGRVVPTERGVLDSPWLNLGESHFRIDREARDWFARANFGGVGVGANMAYRRHLFVEGWRFREDIGLPWEISGEESYALFTLIRDGHTVAYVADAVVQHSVARFEGVDDNPRAYLGRAAAYAIMLLLQEPGHRRDLFTYALNGMLGRRAWWRITQSARTSLGAGGRSALAALDGALRYWRWRRRTHDTGRAPEPTESASLAPLRSCVPPGSPPREIPRVSVIVAAYNAADTITAALQSATRQTYQHFEVLVVDDGSSDDTAKVVTRYGADVDGRVRLVPNSTHIGRSRARNLAISSSSGEYLAILDADDHMDFERLGFQVEYLDRHPNVSVLGGAAWLRNEEGEFLGVQVMPPDDRAARASMMRTSPFIHSTVMMRRGVIDEVGGYVDRYEPCEDYELWFRAARRFQFANAARPVATYRVRAVPPLRSLYWTCHLIALHGAEQRRPTAAAKGAFLNVLKFAALGARKAAGLSLPKTAHFSEAASRRPGPP